MQCQVNLFHKLPARSLANSEISEEKSACHYGLQLVHLCSGQALLPGTYNKLLLLKDHAGRKSFTASIDSVKISGEDD